MTLLTLESFLILLFVLAIITSLLTEGIKKLLDSMEMKYATNVVALFVSIVVGGIGTAVFYLWNDYAWTSLNIIMLFIMVCENWLVAMLGYDKVGQSIRQAANVIKSIS